MKKLIFILLIVTFIAGCGEPIESDEPDPIVEPSTAPIWEKSNDVTESFNNYIAGINKELDYDEVRCPGEPQLEELSFEHLKSKRPLNKLTSGCRLSCIHPACALPDWLYFTGDNGDLVIIEASARYHELANMHAELLSNHFSELFTDLETEEQLLEYVDLTWEIARLDTLDGALEFWGTIDDCDLEEKVPEVQQLITKDNGFIYEGFFVSPESIVDLYHLEYTITPQGKVTKEETFLGECGEGVIF